jgi:hypothetical protein
VLKQELNNKNAHIDHLLEKIQINCQNLIMSLPQEGSELYKELMEFEVHNWRFNQMIHSVLWLSDVAKRQRVRIEKLPKVKTWNLSVDRCGEIAHLFVGENEACQCGEKKRRGAPQ